MTQSAKTKSDQIATPDAGSKCSHPFASVIVTTYNKPDYLGLVLASLACQNTSDYEVVVADDGSNSQTSDIIQQFRSQFRVPLKHAWHADEGFRLARVRNVGVKHANGKLLIFLDGDCTVGRGFVREHQRFCRASWFTGGRRVLFGRSPTQDLLKAPSKYGRPGRLRLLIEGMRGRAEHFEQTFVARNRRPGIADFEAKQFCGFLFSVWRDDYKRVNGFDNRFEGWGLEDLEFFARLRHAGLKSGVLGAAATVVHLWHEESTRPTLAENREIYDETLRTARIESPQGLRQTE